MAWLVARHAPVTGEVEAALRAAVEFVAEEKRMGLRAALDLFRRRK